MALYPTKTRLRLLAGVDAGHVFDWLDDDERLVTWDTPISEVARHRVGHATPGRDCPSCPAGRAEHDGYGCERTGCQVPHWRLIPTTRRTP